MSEVQYTVRDAINRLKQVNALGKTNLSDKGVDLPGEENTTYEVVDGISEIRPYIDFVVASATAQTFSFADVAGSATLNNIGITVTANAALTE